jgi:cytochrome aa3-600 menaquinol oxidase subunit 2
VQRRWHKLRFLLVGGGLALALTGCGKQYVVLHPAGPVAATELHLMLLAAITMAVVIAFVYLLLAVVLVRFRDRPGNRAPYRPDWDAHRGLEAAWFLIPALMLAIIAVPTVEDTFRLARLPQKADPVVIDVTSLTWKWLFEYPGQHVATVNYAVIPVGVPVLFRLFADSAMNTFWVPALGGMEYTMPNEVLPLWLEASRPGVYWGHSGNFSGPGFERMFFTVRAVPLAAFRDWARHLRRTAPAMSMADYRRLLRFGTVGMERYSAYPASTFPALSTGFTLTGGKFMPMMPGPVSAMRREAP